MTTATSTQSGQRSSETGERGVARQGSSQLTTSQGKTAIADGVVSKIAGMAAREVSGVHRMGSGASRAFGSIKERVGGGSPNVSSGVSVEVGETQAAIDLDLVVEYGVSIIELAQSVRRNVIGSVERMTGLEVTEVNIAIDDVHLPTEQDEPTQEAPPRVR